MQAPTKQPRTGFTAIRFPEELRSWIKQQAEANRRTMAAEIIFRMERMHAQEKAKQEASHAQS